MVLLLWVALLGGGGSALYAAITFGALASIVAAPVGASLLTLLTGGLLALRRTSPVIDQACAQEADEQVLALRQVLQDSAERHPNRIRRQAA